MSATSLFLLDDWSMKTVPPTKPTAPTPNAT
jgi:hypothetical protein